MGKKVLHSKTASEAPWVGTFGVHGCKDMATLALPIRQLEYEIGLKAVKLQLEVSRARSSSSRFGQLIRIRWHVAQINRGFGDLIEKQKALIRLLQDTHVPNNITPELCAQISKKLDEVVCDVEKLLDRAAEMPPNILQYWKSNMEKLADQTGHLDSIAESFRVAADPSCTSALARAVEVVSR